MSPLTLIRLPFGEIVTNQRPHPLHSYLWPGIEPASYERGRTAPRPNQSRAGRRSCQRPDLLHCLPSVV